MTGAKPENEHRIKHLGWRLVLIFLAPSVAWIIATDYVLYQFFGWVEEHVGQTIKGLFFIFCCAALLKLVGDHFEARLLKGFERERMLLKHLSRAERVGRMASWQQNVATGETVCNGNCANLLGFDMATGCDLEKGLFSMIHEDDRARVEQARHLWRRDGGSLDLTYRVVHVNGSVVWIQEQSELVEGENGGNRYVVGTFRDISSLKAMEGARFEAETVARRNAQLVRMAAEKAGFGAWRYEVGSAYEIWPPVTDRLRSLTPDSTLTPLKAIENFGPSDRKRVRSAFEACQNEGRPFDEIATMRSGDGADLTVRTLGEPEFDANGNVVAVQGAIQDVTEIIMARQDADRRDAELREVLSSIGDGFVIVDRDWRIRYINENGCSLLGWDCAERSRGAQFSDVFAPAINEHFSERVRDALRRERSVSTVEFIPETGQWFDMRVHPTDDGFAVYFRDDTDRQRDREFLRLLVTSLDHLADIVVLSDAPSEAALEDYRVIYANRATRRYLGYDPQDMRGRSPWSFFDGPTLSEAKATLREALECGRSGSVEVFLVGKDDHASWFEASVAPLPGKAGQRSHFVAVLREITERKNFEDRLIESEERFRLISRASSDVFWDWDIRTGHFWISDRYETVFGSDTTEDPETFDASMSRIHEDDRSALRQSLDAAIAGTASTWSGEYRVRRADGTYAQVQDRACILRDAAGQAYRMVAGMNDVTVLREMERQLLTKEKLEALGHMTGGVAHDFNNLLTVILGSADMLADVLEEPQNLRMAEVILNASERAAALIDSLLAFSRQQQLDQHSFDVNELIRDSEPLIRRSVDERIAVELHLNAEEAVVVTDPSRLASAVINLVINSAHAIPKQGMIVVETAVAMIDDTFAQQGLSIAPGAYLAISVADDGTGMTPETLERAFEPFFTTKPSGQGTGLGLSSTYGLVKQSGGDARIYSEAGVGTTVRLYLPLEHGDDLVARNDRDEPEEKGHGEHVLVVEDDHDLRQHATAQMQSLGYRVTAAPNGDAALRILGNDPKIDLLFTDVVMPGRMNGADLARAAQRMYPDLRVLLTSGYTRDIALHDGDGERGPALLEKPYRRKELARHLRLAIDRA